MRHVAAGRLRDTLVICKTSNRHPFPSKIHPASVSQVLRVRPPGRGFNTCERVPLLFLTSPLPVSPAVTEDRMGKFALSEETPEAGGREDSDPGPDIMSQTGPSARQKFLLPRR